MDGIYVGRENGRTCIRGKKGPNQESGGQLSMSVYMCACASACVHVNGWVGCACFDRTALLACVRDVFLCAFFDRVSCVASRGRNGKEG